MVFPTPSSLIFGPALFPEDPVDSCRGWGDPTPLVDGVYGGSDDLPVRPPLSGPNDYLSLRSPGIPQVRGPAFFRFEVSSLHWVGSGESDLTLDPTTRSTEPRGRLDSSRTSRTWEEGPGPRRWTINLWEYIPGDS